MQMIPQQHNLESRVQNEMPTNVQPSLFPQLLYTDVQDHQALPGPARPIRAEHPTETEAGEDKVGCFCVV